MKYAYIQIGDKVFFQAQNIPNGGNHYLITERGLSIQSISYPADGGSDLFVNGEEGDKSYNIISIPTNRFKLFKELLTTHNARSNNV
jgi:hypothetical protein